jgi:hypothetical protein
MALEAAQDVERARHHLNDIALARGVAGKHSLFTEPLRTPSHQVPAIPLCGIKFHLRDKLPQAICGHNWKPGRAAAQTGTQEEAARGGGPGELNA